MSSTMKPSCLLLTCLFFLIGCSDASKIEKTSLQNVKKHYESQIDYEIKSRLKQDSVFKESYRSTVLSRTSYELDEDFKQLDSKASAKVKVVGIPYKARKVLIEIINRTDEDAKFSFNVPDALRLVLQKLSLPAEGAADKIYHLELHKVNGDWRVVKKKLTNP